MNEKHMRSQRYLAVCKTCVHAEDAGHLTREEDLYICRALVPAPRECAASDTQAHVLVNGCAKACPDHYEQDEAVYDNFIEREFAWTEKHDHPSSIPLHSLLDATGERLW